MPDAVSVRQVNGLPTASFRSRLATDTLAFGYVLGATSCTRDFHPLETCPCRAHIYDGHAGHNAGQAVIMTALGNTIAVRPRHIARE